MATAATASIRSVLGGAIRSALAGNDIFSGLPPAALRPAAEKLDTGKLEELLQAFQREHEAWTASYQKYEQAIAALPPDQRMGRPGLEAAASLAASWASPPSCRRLFCSSAVGAGGSLAARVSCCLHVLEERYSGGDKRPAAQVKALREATEAEREVVALDVELKELRRRYVAGSSLTRPALEGEVVALAAKRDDAERRKAAALEQARQWSAVA